MASAQNLNGFRDFLGKAAPDRATAIAALRTRCLTVPEFHNSLDPCAHPDVPAGSECLIGRIDVSIGGARVKEKRQRRFQKSTIRIAVRRGFR
jgi:hypothetical protein